MDRFQVNKALDEAKLDFPKAQKDHFGNQWYDYEEINEWLSKYLGD